MSQPSGQKLSPFQDLLCGAVAGMSARMVVAPLDVVKIRFQVQSVAGGLYQYGTVTRALRSIVRNEGVFALWKGNVPALLMVAPYASIQLASFYQLSSFFGLTSMRESPSLSMTLGLGAISATMATLATYPLDLLRTRLAAHPDPVSPAIRGSDIGRVTMLREARDIVRTRGPRGLYAGLQPTLIEIVPYMALHFLIYERLKYDFVYQLEIRDQDLQWQHTMSAGATAGTLSKLLTLPLDNAKKVMQVQTQFQSLHIQKQSPITQQGLATEYKGVVDVLYSLWRRHGIMSWFRGAFPSILKAAPNSAVTFVTYESAKRYFSVFSSTSRRD